jgi:ectoine hydroxylase-related dioxygenase (phytanoyl-CoA dioxygenase family)
VTAFKLTAEHTAQFAADGYLFVPNLLDDEETQLLYRVAKADQAMIDRANNGYGRDTKGNVTSILIHNELNDDIYSAIVRSGRIVDTMETLLGGEVYHYHNKMTMKEPYKGGAWEWHQDYGYWYNNGCIYPYMASVMIAVDKSTKENGCLQVLRGSHECGRIEHGVVATQTGADADRVEELKKRMELVYCEMEPGDGLFFHCNTLHRSDANNSPDPRWTFLCCYNAARNDPYKKHGHPNYSYLEKWDDSAIKEVGRRQLAAHEAAPEPVAASVA